MAVDGENLYVALAVRGDTPGMNNVSAQQDLGREIGPDLKLDVGSGAQRQAEPVWNAGGLWA